jgi:hypothetical protein
MKKILFLEEQFSMQGTTRALLDYAYYNQKILGNESVIAFGKKQNNFPWNEPFYNQILENTFDSINNNFELLFYKQNYNILNEYIQNNNFDAIYNIKSGEITGFYTNKIKMLIHAVFPQPLSNIHGHKYAFVSKYLSKSGDRSARSQFKSGTSNPCFFLSKKSFGNKCLMVSLTIFFCCLLSIFISGGNWNAHSTTLLSRNGTRTSKLFAIHVLFALQQSK